MKLVLETKKGTEYRKDELDKLNDHLEKYYYGNEEGPFDCYLQCIKYKKNCEEKCVKKHIKEILRKIDEEGELYL